MKKRSVLFAAIACLLLLGGCWDKHELEDNTFAVLLGIDGAQDRELLVTIAFPLTQTEGGSSGLGDDGGGTYTVMSVKAPTVAEGLDLFSAKLSGPLALYTLKTIVISQEIAQSERLEQVFSSLRYEEIRNTTNVLIAEGSAQAFVEARIEHAPIDPLRQEELLLERTNGSPASQPIQLLDLLTALKTGSGDGVALYGGVSAEGAESGPAPENGGGTEGYLPGEVPITAKNESQITGFAVFRGPRMVGALDSREAQTYSMLTAGEGRTVLALPDPLAPEERIVAEILPGRSTIRSALWEGAPIVQIDLHLTCNIESVESQADYTLPQNHRLLTEYMEGICKENMETLITKLQKEYQADLLRLGDKLARHFPTVQEWEAYDWPTRYQDATIRLTVTLSIERIGTMLP